MLNRLPTRMSLLRKDVSVQNNLCPLCQKVEETIQHLLIGCEVVQKIWDNYDRRLGFSSVRHDDIVNHYENFYVIGLSKKANMIWKGMWGAIVSEV